jgi:hypothetical protein
VDRKAFIQSVISGVPKIVRTLEGRLKHVARIKVESNKLMGVRRTTAFDSE